MMINCHTQKGCLNTLYKWKLYVDSIKLFQLWLSKQNYKVIFKILLYEYLIQILKYLIKSNKENLILVLVLNILI